jgi:4-hydroxy-tetrahydrodipicolinate reductase
MRIAVYGASGRVGTHLVEAILGNPGLDLAAALVSPGSPHLGAPVAGGAMEYRSAEAAINCHCDVIVDFSTPGASLALQDMLGDKPLPTVIGTTGFDAAQREALSTAATRRPLLASANFAIGFEPFAAAISCFAGLQPGAEPHVEEVYHARKKREASGTSRRLVAAIAEAQGPEAGPAPLRVMRRGDTVGVNSVRFDMGSSEVTVSFKVHRLAAYAEGALAAARWLLTAAPGNGLFSFADTLVPAAARG